MTDIKIILEACVRTNGHCGRKQVSIYLWTVSLLRYAPVFLLFSFVSAPKIASKKLDQGVELFFSCQGVRRPKSKQEARTKGLNIL